MLKDVECKAYVHTYRCNEKSCVYVETEKIGLVPTNKLDEYNSLLKRISR